MGIGHEHGARCAIDFVQILLDVLRGGKAEWLTRCIKEPDILPRLSAVQLEPKPPLLRSQPLRGFSVVQLLPA